MSEKKKIDWGHYLNLLRRGLRQPMHPHCLHRRMVRRPS